MNKDSKMDVRIPSDLKQMVGEEAKRQDRSKAWIVIEALKQYLSKKREQK